MSPSTTESRPRQALRRAANLLTTNGFLHLHSEQVIVMERDGSDTTLPSVSRNKSIGASIKRKLQEAKSHPIVRSISSRRRHSESESNSRPPIALLLNDDHKGTHHSGAFSSSEFTTTRPTIHNYTALEPLNGPERSDETGEVKDPISPLPSTKSISRLPPTRSKTRQTSMADVPVPTILHRGVPMTKVSAKRQKTFVFRLDPDQGHILYESNKTKIIPIETIKEIRSTSDGRFYREQFQLAQSYEDRWLTITYILEGGTYKTLHLIATTKEIFSAFNTTLRNLWKVRCELMSGLGNVELRQRVWEKQYWKEGEGSEDSKLNFGEMETLCKRLNVNSSTDTLIRLFQEADTEKRGYLDFPQFQRFVKMLKARPELDQLWKKLCANNNGVFDFGVFEAFMRDSQKSSLSREELEKVFMRYSISSVPTGAAAEVHPTSSHDTVAQPPVPASTPSASSSTAPTSTPPVSAPSDPDTVTLPLGPAFTSTPTSIPLLPSPETQPSPTPPIGSYTLSLDGFTAFLLSPDNSAFTDQHGKIYHDMTRPLSEYYISTSHNTYLVGHQLVGVSTIEGYIRTLLHGCRSVELDIYDGEKEPVIFHGKTLTTKVALRQVCQAIARYAFVASPYPVIISAEVHCSLPQQDMIADIMTVEFGDTLVNAPIDGRKEIQLLPSPEDLKGRILLKAKNLYVSSSEEIRDKEVSVDTESSSTETSDSDMIHEIKDDWKKARILEGVAVKELKDEFKKARNSDAIKDIKEDLHSVRQSVIGRLKGQKKTPSAVSQALVAPPVALASVRSSLDHSSQPDRPKVKMSARVVSLLIYTVGVKCRGINKKEVYAPEHVFSLSERTANKILKQGMQDLIKHNRTHVVRIYPKGLRLNSTNYEPHRYWSAGAQLVAINWQTFDLGYMINHSMFQRNGRSGYVLKPPALRTLDKELLSKRSKNILSVTIISAQQLPRLKDELGHEIIGKSAIDPFVEVSIHVPDWTHTLIHNDEDAGAHSAHTSPTSPSPSRTSSGPKLTAAISTPGSTSPRTLTYRTGVVKNNGFNPVWQEELRLPFECVGDMLDLVFVKVAVKHEGQDSAEPLAIYCSSLGSLQMGYRHLPLHDAQLSQYLFSTLFVQINIHDM